MGFLHANASAIAPQNKHLPNIPLFESFDKTFSKVFCDPTASTLVAPRTERNTRPSQRAKAPFSKKPYAAAKKEAKNWVHPYLIFGLFFPLHQRGINDQFGEFCRGRRPRRPVMIDFGQRSSSARRTIKPSLPLAVGKVSDSLA